MKDRHSFTPTLAQSLHNFTSNDDYFEMMAAANRDMQTHRNSLAKNRPAYVTQPITRIGGRDATAKDR